MHVTRYTSASDFFARTQALLEHRESFNTLMLDICHTLINRAEQYPDFFLWTVDSQ